MQIVNITSNPTHTYEVQGICYESKKSNKL